MPLTKYLLYTHTMGPILLYQIHVQVMLYIFQPLYLSNNSSKNY